MDVVFLGCLSITRVVSDGVVHRRDVDTRRLGEDQGDQTRPACEVAPYSHVHGDGHKPMQVMAQRDIDLPSVD